MRPYEDSSYHQDWSSFASGQNNVSQQFIASIQTKYVSSNLLSVSLNQSSFRNLGNLSGFTIAAKQKKEECMSPGMDVYGYIVIEY